MQGIYNEAIASLNKAIEAAKEENEYYRLLGDLGSVYARAKRKSDAVKVLKKLTLLPDEQDTEWPRIEILLELGEINQAFRLLERGAKLMHPWVYNIPSILDLRFGARYDPLRADPKFVELMKSCFNSSFCR